MESDLRAQFLSVIHRTKVQPNPRTEGLFLFEDEFIRQDIFISTEENEYSPVPIVLVASTKFVNSNGIVKLPVLFLLHSTSKSNKFLIESTKLPQRFASLGFLVVLMDARYHGERLKTETDKESSPSVYLNKLDEAYVDQNGEMPFIYDNIWDLIAVLDYLELQYNHEGYKLTMIRDKNNPSDTSVSIEIDLSLGVGTTGISLGGMHSWFLAFADSRITCSAPCIGVQNFRWGVENNQWQARVDSIKNPFLSCMKKLGKSEIDQQVVEDTYNVLNPGLLDKFDIIHTLPTLVPTPFFVMNGELDPRCPIAGMDNFMQQMIHRYDEAGKIENFEYHWEKGIAHEATEEMFLRIIYFLLKKMIPTSSQINVYAEVIDKMNQKEEGETILKGKM